MIASPSSRVRRLPDVIVNRIAAGEVIERPAAALKELAENAVDAGARRISVSVEGGGTDRIIVTDDGIGMTPEELELAVQRHCTSKLTDESLIRISTLGFRGEALPSIGAAARLTITSRVAEADTAWRIRVEGGVVTGPEPCAGPRGTQVIVEDLFFATPARRKFLKSARVEGKHAETVVRRLAFGAPGVAFRMEADGRLLFDLPLQDLQDRAVALLDAGDATGFLPVEGVRNDMRLSGYVCSPAIHRPTASGQYMLVNGRPVSDPLLKTAIRVAFRRVIEVGRHPVLVLSLDLPPDQVDVNVHPAKTELRFADEAGVRSLVIGSVGRALGLTMGHSVTESGLRAALPPAVPSSAARPARIWYPPEERQMQPDPGLAGFAETGPAPSLPVSPTARVFAPEAVPSRDTHPLGAAVAQVFSTYILAVTEDDGLILVDQHAAHERLTHEVLRKQYLSGQVTGQRLLVPDVIDLPQRQADILLSQADILAGMGITIEAFGPGAVVVRSLPAILKTSDAGMLLRDLADELDGDETGSANEAGVLETRLDAIIARMACHGSIRAGRRMTPEEMNALLRQIESTPHAGTCSHGRPTWVRLERRDLESLFRRG
ncbi:DNA mismatch repair endonuclease MutL [Acetobacter sp. AN02]|uniref:DNA mismatch repair endonuclease MutL n=1 Tax=Acetobacter sp. AN02 TaxID=2894186 RepID=UPI00243437A3|nr:DNA mismatch repair endonuclease MutL [Acetobacter sp. AN02]MDG6094400.1 DNA mismatch repair endonuclease MutL [Acetobacter sp. AN02]